MFQILWCQPIYVDSIKSYEIKPKVYHILCSIIGVQTYKGGKYFFQNIHKPIGNIKPTMTAQSYYARGEIHKAAETLQMRKSLT